MDPLRFGPLDATTPTGCCPGSWPASAATATAWACPTSAARPSSTPTYLGNPLVNALCVGVLRHEDLHLAKASGVGNQVILYGARTGGDGIGGVCVLASETFDETAGPAEAAQRPGRRPVHGEAADRVHPRALRGRRGRRHPGPRRRRPLLRHLRAGQRRRRRHARRARPGPAPRLHARARGDPDERVAGADDGGRRARRRRRRSSRSAPKWEVDAVVIGEVTDTGRLDIDWHGERVVDVPPRTVAHDGPTYHRPFARPAWQDALQADGAESLPRPTGGDELRETLLRMVGQPQPLRQVLDHRPVRPLRPRQHRPGPAQRQRHDPGRRGDQPRGRGLDRLQRPLRQARPVRRSAARAGRVLPQRRHRRRPAARGHRLPQLRLPRGPGRDVAVRRGLPRPEGRLPRARHPGHRRQRQPLQPDRRDRDPADPGGRGARRHRRRHPAHARPASRPRTRRSSCSGRPARSSPAPSGPTSSTATSAGCRRRSTWPPSAPWPSCWRPGSAC